MSYSNREGGCLIWPGHEGRATYDGRTDVFYVTLRVRPVAMKSQLRQNCYLRMVTSATETGRY